MTPLRPSGTILRRSALLAGVVLLVAAGPLSTQERQTCGLDLQFGASVPLGELAETAGLGATRRPSLASRSQLPIDDHTSTMRYQLLIDDNAPTTGTIRLVLDSALTSETDFLVRQLRDSNVESPVCVTSGTKLRHREAGWLAPAGCSELSWKIDFTEVLQPEHDVSAQENLYYPGRWWLFSEWGSLLRSASGPGEADICATRGTIETCRRVPTVEDPPLLMLIGEPSDSIVFGETSVRFFTGHLPDSFDVAGLYGSYERQISYLHAVLAETTGTPPPGVIDVLLLGMDSDLGVVGGAAGKDSYLANVAVTEQHVDPSERTRLLWISGHELAHMLGLGTEVLWASESLAHYYGFKSLGGSTEASERFEQMTEDLDPMGLLEAHRRVTREGEGQYYPRFYTKGAAFWRDVDEAIIAATRDDSSLDDLLPLLINGEFGPDGELPPEFVQVVGEWVGREEIERIIRAYLSGRSSPSETR